MMCAKRYVAHRLLLDENDYIAGTLDVDRDRSGDWAVIKLARPVARGVPFSVGDDRVWRINNSIVMISATMSDKPSPAHKDNPGLPIAQKCTIRHLSRGISARSFISDCDTKSGASGGVSIMRLDGNLVLAGITVGNSGTQDYQPFGPKNFAASISVTDAVINGIFRFSAGAIKTSAHQKNSLLAGDIGDELDEPSRLIALRTEIQALNNFRSTGSLRWKSQNASGYVLPLPHNGPPLAIDRCRGFVHAVIYAPERVKSARGKVCREKNGQWMLARNEPKTQLQLPGQGAGAPPCASADQESRKTPSSLCR